MNPWSCAAQFSGLGGRPERLTESGRGAGDCLVALSAVALPLVVCSHAVPLLVSCAVVANFIYRHARVGLTPLAGQARHARRQEGHTLGAEGRAVRPWYFEEFPARAAWWTPSSSSRAEPTRGESAKAPPGLSATSGRAGVSTWWPSAACNQQGASAMDNHDWATRAVGQSVRRLRVPGRTWPSANAKCNGAFAGYVLAAAAESSAYCGAGAREPVCLLLTFAMHHIARWVATGDVDVAVDLISEPNTFIIARARSGGFATSQKLWARVGARGALATGFVLLMTLSASCLQACCGCNI